MDFERQASEQLYTIDLKEVLEDKKYQDALLELERKLYSDGIGPEEIVQDLKELYVLIGGYIEGSEGTYTGKLYVAGDDVAPNTFKTVLNEKVVFATFKIVQQGDERHVAISLEVPAAEADDPDHTFFAFADGTGADQFEVYVPAQEGETDYVEDFLARGNEIQDIINSEQFLSLDQEMQDELLDDLIDELNGIITTIDAGASASKTITSRSYHLFDQLDEISSGGASKGVFNTVEDDSNLPSGNELEVFVLDSHNGSEASQTKQLYLEAADKDRGLVYWVQISEILDIEIDDTDGSTAAGNETLN